jgi:hypothetical protein
MASDFAAAATTDKTAGRPAWKLIILQVAHVK